MRPDYEKAFKFVMEHEVRAYGTEDQQSFVNHPDDPGGATNYGVSLRWLRKNNYDVNGDGDIDIVDVEVLNEDDAYKIYKEFWWKRYGYGEFFSHDIATKVFDLSINMGPTQAHKILQRACRATSEPIAEDGVLGPVTLSTVNNIHPLVLLPAIRSEAAGFYRSLGREEFLKGWLNRAYA